MTLDVQTTERQRRNADEALKNVDREARKTTSAQVVRNDITLNDTRAWFRRFIKTQSGDDLDVLALWTVHTYLLAWLPTSPRLIIDSIVYGSGKTTTLEHIEQLGHETIIASGIGSSALLPRMIAAADANSITILVDEADRTLDSKKEGTGDLLAVINSGSKRGATRPVLVPTKGGGWEAERMPTYAAVAMAGNNPNLPDDTRSRAVSVYLLPDWNGDAEETDWVTSTELTDEAKSLHEEIAAWAEANSHDVQSAAPELPEGCRGRLKERWVSFAKIAQVAGGTWPDRVNRLILKDIDRLAKEREDGLNNLPPRAMLLPDLLKVFNGRGDFLSTIDILTALANIAPERWGIESPYGTPITRQRLAKMLSPMGIHSVKSSTRADRSRGYRRADIERVAVKAHIVQEPESGD